MAALISKLGERGVVVDASKTHRTRIERRNGILYDLIKTHSQVGYILPVDLVPWLVRYCIYISNMIPNTGGYIDTVPRELLTGVAIDMKRDLPVKFGEIVAFSPDMEPGTPGAVGIALLPTGNSIGSVWILNIATGGVVKRSQFEVIPMTENIQQTLNEWSTVVNIKSIRKFDAKVIPYLFEKYLASQVNKNNLPVPEIDLHKYSKLTTWDSNKMEKPNMNEFRDPLSAHLPETNFDLVTRPEEENYNNTDVVENLENQPTTNIFSNEFTENVSSSSSLEMDQLKHRYSGRVSKPTQLLSYDHSGNQTQHVSDINSIISTSIVNKLSAKQIEKDEPEKAFEAKYKELKSFHDKGALEVIDPSTMTSADWKRVIPILSLYNNKHNTLTNEDILKFRMVARGDLLNPQLYEGLSTAAPTLSTLGLFIILKYMVHKKFHRKFIDIGTAFLNAPRDSSTDVVYLNINSSLVKIFEKIDPKYGKYKLENGNIIVKNVRAVYGEPRAPMLWYLEIKNTLLDLGYVPHKLEPCIFLKFDNNGNESVIMIFVDDFSLSGDNAMELERVYQHLLKKYNSIKVIEEINQSVVYLGLTLDFSVSGQVSIKSTKYIDLMLEELKIVGTVTNPSTSTLFIIREDAKPLTKELKKVFHTNVARALFFAKRTRPDILLVVNFLSGRVDKADEDDWSKLIHLCKYLNLTRDFALVLKGDANFDIQLYVDASYACHPDFKGQTGMCLYIGDSCVLAKSTKQKIVAKSSTESEVIAVADSASQAIYCKDFLEELGINTATPVIYQDNNSALSLMSNELCANERTKHFGIKYTWIQQGKQQNSFGFKRMPTEKMIADALTKHLPTGVFNQHRDRLLGHSGNIGRVSEH